MNRLKIILLPFFVTTIMTSGKSQSGVTSYPLPAGAIYPKHDLKIDAAGNKWVAFGKMGLGKFNGTTWAMFDTLTSGIPSNQINGIAFDPSNNVWVATIKGLAKYDGISWTIYNVINSGLPDDSVSCVSVNNTDIWAGTRNGLAKFDGSTWSVYNTSNSDLTTNRIQCIATESTGDAYVGTRLGLFKKSGSVWSNFNAANPYLVNTYDIGSVYIDASHTAWVDAKGNLGDEPYKAAGSKLVPLASLFPGYLGLSTGLNAASICKGPMGGVMYKSGSGLIEIIGSQLYKYTYAGGTYNALDPATGLVWSTNLLGPGSITSFNYLSYSGTALASPNYPIDENSLLNINMVSASVLNLGDGDAVEVPKASQRKTTYASSLWIGGIDNANALHQSAMTYRQTGNDFWPGPLDTISGTTDSSTSAIFDKVWKISRLKIEEFKYMFALGAVASGTYTVDNNILTWPAIGTGNITRKLAPFIDVNHDGMYNPIADGDYPDIKGDEMCYSIFNDNLLHGETGGTPLIVEVHASAYQYVCPTITDSLKALNYTTFYHFEIFNRSTENYHNTFLGIWQDVDLGSASDDFVGCTPSSNYGSFFNGDDVDDNPPSGQITYGISPPMQSTVILNGPLAEPGDGIDNNNNGTIDEAGEKNLMTHFMYYITTMLRQPVIQMELQIFMII